MLTTRQNYLLVGGPLSGSTVSLSSPSTGILFLRGMTGAYRLAVTFPPGIDLTPQVNTSLTLLKSMPAKAVRRITSTLYWKPMGFGW